MTVQAHDVRYVNRGATKTPTVYVRTVQEKRRPLGWMECTADEFMRLLALHNKGEINLLAMPEYASDPIADEVEAEVIEEADEASEPTRRLVPGQRDPGATVKIIKALAQTTRALSTSEVAKATRLTIPTVGTILRRNPQWFERVSEGNRWIKWQRTKEDSNVV